jgi:hypothetical protein
MFYISSNSFAEIMYKGPINKPKIPNKLNPIYTDIIIKIG